jgi:hypothetical protein
MRRLLAVLLLAIVATSVHGAAATLGVSARPLGAGSSVVGRCHTGTAPVVAYTYTNNTVTGLTVSNLHADFNGGHLQAVVTDSAGADLRNGTSSVQVGGATVTFSSPVAAAAVAGYRISIVT